MNTWTGIGWKAYENKGPGILFDIENVKGVFAPAVSRIAKMLNRRALVIQDGWLTVKISLVWGDALLMLMFVLECWGERIKWMR